MSLLVRRLAVPWYLIIAISIPLAARAQTPSAAQTDSTLVPPWLAQDLGNSTTSGWAMFDNDRLVVAAGGEDTGASDQSSDQYRFVFQRLNGNVQIKARVDSLAPLQGLAKAGLMIRSSLDPAAAHGAVLLNADGELAFHGRQQSGASAMSLSGTIKAAFPQWMALQRMGLRVVAYSSSDGNTWTRIGSAAIELDETVYVGIAVTSNDTTVRTVAEISQVSVSGLPPPQQQRNIGGPATPGSAWYTSGRYTITGGGTIGDTQDQFNLVYQAMQGDVDIVARVASLSAANQNAKAGVMIRETLTEGSPHAFAVVSAGNGYAFDRRDRLGSSSEHIDGGHGTAPGWVRLVRSGNNIEALRSQDGRTWTSMGSTSLSMNERVYVGLTTTSEDANRAATAVFDQVSITSGANDLIGLPNLPPVVALTNPVPGATFTAPASIVERALASDPEGRLAEASTAPHEVIFTASIDHDTYVTNYLLEVFASGVDPNTGPATASSDLGKPTPDANRDVTVDQTSFFNALSPGNYMATVAAVGDGGSARSEAVAFTR